MSIQELWKKFKETNDIYCKQEIIKEYISIVKIVAGRMYNYYGGNVDFDDLVGFGIFGLVDAIEKFDTTRDLKFETYAQIRIRGSIIDNLRKLDWIPRSLRKKAKALENTIKLLENRLGRKATNEEIAKEMNISTEEVEKSLSEISTFNIVSFEELLAIQGDFTHDKSNLNPELVFEELEVKEGLSKAIDSLGEKEKLVISLYYYNGLTYKEIGKIMDLSESRISQIHSKAISCIKNELQKNGFLNNE